MTETALSNAVLASKVDGLVSRWNLREDEYTAWLNGTPNGGPNGDGTYPITDAEGVIRFIEAPATLAAMVTGPAAAAQVVLTETQAARDVTLAARDAATSQAVLAEQAKNDARGARDLALTYRDEAASHFDNAHARATAAAASATEAASSEANAKASEDIAEASAAQAVQKAGEAVSAASTAMTKASEASASAIAANASKVAAKDSEDAAKVSENAALASAASAADDASTASLAAASATASALTASQKADDAAAHSLASEDNAQYADVKAQEAAASALAAANSAAAAQTFDPALYAPKADPKFSGHVLVGTDVSDGAGDRRLQIGSTNIASQLLLKSSTSYVALYASASVDGYLTVPVGGAFHIGHGAADGSSFASRVQIDEDGRIGVGVTPGDNPAAFLDITRGGSRTADLSFILGGQSLHSVAANASYCGLGIRTNYDGHGNSIIPGSPSWYVDIGGRNLDGAAADCFRIARKPSGASNYPTYFCIDSGGRVGIGNSTPLATIDATGDSIRLTRPTSYGQSANATFEIGSSTPASVNNGTPYAWRMVVSGDSAGQALDFQAILRGGTPTTRARLTSEGSLLVNTTHAGSQNSNHSALLGGANAGILRLSRLGASELAQFWVGGVQSGNISATTTTTSYNTSSDYRLKTNFQSIRNPIERLLTLNPLSFEWALTGERVDGFLAHEVQHVSPEAVTGYKDQVDGEGNPVFQSIDQSKLVPVLTAALQEAVYMIQDLTIRLEAIEKSQEIKDGLEESSPSPGEGPAPSEEDVVTP